MKKRDGERMDITIIYALMTFTLFGITNFLVKKAGVESSNPLLPSVILWLSVGGMGLIFLVYFYFTDSLSSSIISKPMLIPAIAGITLALGMFTLTYAMHHGGKAGVIVAVANANTLLVSLLAYLAFGETLTYSELGGITLIILGIVLMSI